MSGIFEEIAGSRMPVMFGQNMPVENQENSDYLNLIRHEEIFCTFDDIVPLLYDPESGQRQRTV